jgi:hypothetical protein
MAEPPTGSANGTHTAETAEAPPRGADRVAAAVADLMDASMQEGRKWMATRGDRRPPLSHTSMKAWLVRSLFLLLAATIVMATGLAGLGLLSALEAATVLSPVATLSAAVIGFYFGDRETH